DYPRVLTMGKEQSRLGTLDVRGVLYRPARAPPADTSLRRDVRRFNGGSLAYPIVDENGRLAGYFGRSELFDALRGGRAPETKIRDFMRKDPPVVTQNQTVFDASVVLLRGDMHLLPVVSTHGARNLVALITPSHLI